MMRTGIGTAHIGLHKDYRISGTQNKATSHFQRKGTGTSAIGITKILLYDFTYR